MKNIEVKGKVIIGEELELVEHKDPRRSDSFNYVPTVGGVLPPHRRRPIGSSPDNPIEKRKIEYELKKNGRKLLLEDQGLVLQYAVFGGPGSGKTNLLMHLLSQIVYHRCMDTNRKYGGLILDPKAALIEDVKAIFDAYGRRQDLIIINRRELLEEGGVNVIGCYLDPYDLGNALAIAAQSAGIQASEPYWFQQIGSIFGAVMQLQRFSHGVPTIAGALELANLTSDVDNPDIPKLETLIEEIKMELDKSSKESSQNDPTENDLVKAIDDLQKYLKSDEKTKVILAQFMEQAFGAFGTYPNNLCYSENSKGVSFYDQIIDDGKFVLVSTGPQEIRISSILPTLIKLIFQRSVLSRFERYKNGELHNAQRPLLFMADEYHTVATQLEGNPFGDSEFFSQTRQFGALSIVATQSIKQLEVSKLGKAWEAIPPTLAAIIFMRQKDPSTGEFAQKYSGDIEYIIHRASESTTKEGTTRGDNVDLTKEKGIPPSILEHKLTVGQAIVVGTTQGQSALSSVKFVQVPEFKPPTSTY